MTKWQNDQMTNKFLQIDFTQVWLKSVPSFGATAVLITLNLLRLDFCGVGQQKYQEDSHLEKEKQVWICSRAADRKKNNHNDRAYNASFWFRASTSFFCISVAAQGKKLVLFLASRFFFASKYRNLQNLQEQVKKAFCYQKLF